MATQPSVHHEDRNRLRLQAREQRNQETSQGSDFSPEDFPVFGEPYKVHKGDELSNRIRRMLGSYEDVSSPGPAEVLPLPASASSSQPDRRPSNSDRSTEPPSPGLSPTEGRTGPPTVPSSSRPVEASGAAASSPAKREGRPSASAAPSADLGQSGELGPKSDVPSDVAEMSSASPHAEPPPPPLHSGDRKAADADAEEPSDGRRPRRSEDVAAQNAKPSSPEDLAAASHANKTAALPSQTFPPLLASKQPCAAATQKPTAYVRPMDGQDQVASQSPELKPSPSPSPGPYPPPAETIGKSDLGEDDAKPQPLEGGEHEAQRVEDILREMTESWPPLLAALHTPDTRRPSRFLFPVKEAERLSSGPGRKSRDASSSLSSNLKQQPSSNSSDSDSSTGSESESDAPAEELRPFIKPQAAAGPVLGAADWQLGNWIRSSRQTSGADGSAHKPPLHPQSSKHSGAEAVVPAATSRPRSSAAASIPQQRRDGPRDKPGRIGRRKPVSAGTGGGRGLVKSEAAATKDSCPTDKPKVKTKAGHGESLRDKSGHGESLRDKSGHGENIGDKSGHGESLRDNSGHGENIGDKAGHGESLGDKAGTQTDPRRTKAPPLGQSRQKTAGQCGPEVSLLPPSQCPSCGVPRPNRCSCSAHSPAPPRTPAPASPHRGTRGKSRAGTRKPPKTTSKHLKPLSLLVKINLRLLCRVPPAPTSSSSTTSTTTRQGAPRGRGGGGGATSGNRTVTSKKHKMSNVDGDGSSAPPKKRRLENHDTSALVSRKPGISSKPAEATAKKKVKKTPRAPPAGGSGETARGGAPPAGGSGETARRGGASSGRHGSKRRERPAGGQLKPPGRSGGVAPSPPRPLGHALTTRPLLRADDRQYPVKHYIKEAKRLKHRADAESDKLSKAFSYLDAAMFFVESAVAMETDPQVSMSSYTMLAETLELLRFVLKLKNSLDSFSSASENDFLALCLKCQSLLQMAMFRHKHKTALKYSKTLTEYFAASAPGTHQPARDQPSPVPPSMEQVVFSYVNITTLVLSAHDLWEQAEELAGGGSGLLSELDTVLGPLSLSAGMSSLVRYTRQGVHWLRLHSLKV